MSEPLCKCKLCTGQDSLESTVSIADRMGLNASINRGLSDMIEAGRLTKGDIPDDWEWLLARLQDAGFNPATPEE